MVYLGIDIGTTGSKATAIDQNGNARAFSHGEYKTVRNDRGYSEIDPISVWKTVQEIIADAAAQAGEPVKAISVASFGEAFVALDSHDNILRNSILYSDVRGSEEIQDILEKFSEQELFDITGMPVNSMFTLNKLLWVKKHEPETFRQISKLFLIQDFIGYMLTGERFVDYSMASRTQFFDVKNLRWADRVLDTFGIDASMLSIPVPTGHLIGKISARVADQLGLPQDVLLIAGAHDQVCAALGSGVLSQGQCVDGIGTSECITTILSGFDQQKFMLENHFCIEPYAVAGEYVTLAFNSSGASILSWFCEQFVNPTGKPCGRAEFRLIEDNCPADPTGLFALPHFAGSGTPHMDPFSTGAIFGLRLNTKREEVYKALVEGLCFEMKVNSELLKSVGTKISEITCTGGGSRSDMLLQVKADVMGIPIKRLKVVESGTMALAMLCETACSEFASLGEAVQKMVQTDRIFYPNPRNHEIYLERFEIYKKIYSQTSFLRQ